MQAVGIYHPGGRLHVRPDAVACRPLARDPSALAREPPGSSPCGGLPARLGQLDRPALRPWNPRSTILVGVSVVERSKLDTIQSS
jgi:hypothetical protein